MHRVRRTGSIPAWLGILVVMVLLTGTASSTASAAAQTFTPRRIMVFYNSDEGLNEEDNFFRAGFQMVANYMGYLVEYRDAAARPLPAPETMTDVAAVVTSFYSGEMADPDAFNAWLLAQSEAGRKLVLLGTLAGARPDETSEDPELHEALFRQVGLRFISETLHDRSMLDYVHLDDAMTGFERAMPQPPPAWANITLEVPGARTLVAVHRRDRPGEVGSMVSVGPGGGHAFIEFLAWTNPYTYDQQWHVDPFAFLGACLHGAQTPPPAFAPAMRNGARLAFTHVDGDAFAGFTEIRADANCAEILRDEIFTRYDLPFTISVIVAEIDPELKGDARSMALAQELFALPNVEPASHTFSHPFFWDANKTADKLGLYGRHAYTIPGYDFDPAKEIEYSTRWISERLAPPEKPCRVLLWSGDCAPTPEQIAIADDAGLLQMNGGDTVYDDAQNSLFNVAPLYRAVGGVHQIHTGQANENILTNLWTGPFFGYRSIVETMKRTGTPRVLAPVNPYYHFYSAEKAASVAALHTIYEWMTTQDLAHVFASEWILAVRGFLEGRIVNTAPDRYRFSHFGACRTVRFPPDAHDPDLERCAGVLGYRRTAEGLFIHFMQDAQEAVVTLDAAPQRIPHIRQASGEVRDFTAKEGGAACVYEGPAPGFVEFAGLAPDTPFTVRVGEQSSIRQSNADGVMRVDATRLERVEVAP